MVTLLAANASATPAVGERVHISELAHRAFVSDRVEGSHQRLALHLKGTSAGGSSAFARGLRHFWKPGAMKQGIHPLIQRRQGPLPTQYDWDKRAVDEANFSEPAFLRAAVIKTAATWADKDGYVDLGAMRKKFGPGHDEQLILDELSRPADARLTTLHEDSPWSRRLQYLDQRTLRMVVSPMTSALVPKDMHALPWITRSFDKTRALGGVQRVWARQHILGNTLAFLEATGLPAKKTDVWGKSYSLDPRIAPVMIDRGYRVHGGDIDAHELEAQIASEVAKIPEPGKLTKPKFLLLDDGGELIELVARIVAAKFPAHAHLFAAVEQTQGGINRLENAKLPFAVVASGSSWGKKAHGSTMFGHAVSLEIEHKLAAHAGGIAYGLYGSKRKEMTVLGYGEMGASIAKHFRQAGYEVVVYDPSPEKQAAAAREGMKVVMTKQAALATAHVLVSAVGRTAFEHADYGLLPHGAIVFNAASSNELPRIGSEHGGLPRPDDADYLNMSDWGRTLFPSGVDREGDTKTLLFVKDGGVINFPLEKSHPRAGKLVPGRYIQYQLGLLYLDALHAMRGGHGTGLVDAPVEPQRKLATFVQEELARRGESLDDPRWTLTDAD